MTRPPRRLPEARAMVVAAQPKAADAGAVTLGAGGNAVDAALAAAMVQGVVDPLMSGLGGYGVLHLHDPATGQTLLLDGQGAARSPARRTCGPTASWARRPTASGWR